MALVDAASNGSTVTNARSSGADAEDQSISSLHAAPVFDGSPAAAAAIIVEETSDSDGEDASPSSEQHKRARLASGAEVVEYPVRPPQQFSPMSFDVSPRSGSSRLVSLECAGADGHEIPHFGAVKSPPALPSHGGGPYPIQSGASSSAAPAAGSEQCIVEHQEEVDLSAELDGMVDDTRAAHFDAYRKSIADAINAPVPKPDCGEGGHTTGHCLADSRSSSRG